MHFQAITSAHAISILVNSSKTENCGNSPLKSWKKRAEERMNKGKVRTCMYCLRFGSSWKIEKNYLTLSASNATKQLANSFAINVCLEHCVMK